MQIKVLTMDKKSIQIYVIHYKNDHAFPQTDGYLHLWADKPNNASNNSHLIGDNTGVNIASKNNHYSELTAIYWIWKNQTADIFGTCHYRRFFTIYNEPLIYRLKRCFYYPFGLWRKRFGLIYTNNTVFWGKRILTSAQINSLFDNGYDAVLPISRKLRYNVEKHFSRYHQLKDLQLMKQIVNELYPDYNETFSAVLKGKRLYANNMFILKKHNFDILCEWLFTLLFEFENRVDLNQYINYQERILGFLSERLITTWIIHNDLKIKELPIIYFKHFKHQ